MSKSPKSSKIMTSASPFVFGCIPHLNMDLSIYTPTWHRVLLSGKNSNPTGSHPLVALCRTCRTNNFVHRLALLNLHLTGPRLFLTQTTSEKYTHQEPTEWSCSSWATESCGSDKCFKLQCCNLQEQQDLELDKYIAKEWRRKFEAQLVSAGPVHATKKRLKTEPDWTGPAVAVVCFSNNATGPIWTDCNRFQRQLVATSCASSTP